MPTARDGRFPIRVAAVAGTTMLMVAAVIVPDGPLLVTMPRGTAAVGTLLLVAMETLALYGLITLRRSFSIIPEARRVVTSGPYRLIRHPLYFAEIGAAAAIVLPAPRLWAVLLLPPFIALQMIRAGAEERLLRRALPAYAAYQARTRKLIPGIW
jgi:protein-S-isoprenylcysteine O-methyltransferase Ste14